MAPFRPFLEVVDCRQSRRSTRAGCRHGAAVSPRPAEEATEDSPLLQLAQRARTVAVARGQSRRPLGGGVAPLLDAVWARGAPGGCEQPRRWRAVCVQTDGDTTVRRGRRGPLRAARSPRAHPFSPSRPRALRAPRAPFRGPARVARWRRGALQSRAYGFAPPVPSGGARRELRGVRRARLSSLVVKGARLVRASGADRSPCRKCARQPRRRWHVPVRFRRLIARSTTSCPRPTRRAARRRRLAPRRPIPCAAAGRPCQTPSARIGGAGAQPRRRGAWRWSRTG